MGQAALTCSLLLGKDVTLESMLTLDLTRSGESETLLRTGIGFHLRHNARFLVFPHSSFRGAAKIGILTKEPITRLKFFRSRMLKSTSWKTAF